MFCFTLPVFVCFLLFEGLYLFHLSLMSLLPLVCLSLLFFLHSVGLSSFLSCVTSAFCFSRHLSVYSSCVFTVPGFCSPSPHNSIFILRFCSCFLEITLNCFCCLPLWFWICAWSLELACYLFTRLSFYKQLISSRLFKKHVKAL